MIQPENGKPNAWPMYLADVQFGKVRPIFLLIWWRDGQSIGDSAGGLPILQALGLEPAR